ncbi:hypothetical protein F383_38266 [Gossypium arboreum]|uniref:Uncharacterized protein n=1 Tax=Gossypium arboreum TaxID=29729 RepID=A0A0B0MDZ6_GOSAR|nr:hypothetical protein F383_38266 [Gossypium arboreum]
MLFSLQSYIGV